MKIAIIQMTSVLEPKVNLSRINSLILKAKQQSSEIQAVFLPEVFYSMSDGVEATPFLVEENNDHFKAIQNIAIEHDLAILGGSAATKLGNKIVNRCYNFSKDGELLAFYDKIHLFAVDLKGKNKSTVLDEAKIYSAGSQLKHFEFNKFKIGLSICFDVRFPELYRKYYSMGVNVLTVSAAFTVPTGQAHWETLLRARAIENQSYVIASAQWGKHNQKIETYGHSMVVDPWGKIIAQITEGEDVIVCEIDHTRLDKIQTRMDMNTRLIT